MDPKPSAAELQQQMEQIRCELCGDINQLATSARTLTDYRYYFRRYPWACLATAAAVGYLLVPQRVQKTYYTPDTRTLIELAKKEQLVVKPDSDFATKKGLIASAVGLAGTAALRMAMNYVGQNAGSWFSASRGSNGKVRPQ